MTPQFLNIRMAYDQPRGVLHGAGAFIEEDIRESFYLDNANLLRAPGSNTMNLNFHYNPTCGTRVLSRFNFYLEVKNVIGKAYVASASNITDSLNTSTGAENGLATLGDIRGLLFRPAAIVLRWRADQAYALTWREWIWQHQYRRIPREVRGALRRR